MNKPEGAQALSLDGIYQGRGALWQHRDGYRFGIDSVILGAGAAHLAQGQPGARVLDACCGVGVVGLCLLLALPAQEGLSVLGVERQPLLAALTRRNVAHNGQEARYSLHEGDLRGLSPELHGRFELVLLNPPYFGPTEGMVNPQRERAEARHELHGVLGELLQGCARVLERKGLIRVIYPARKLVYALGEVRRAGLHPARLRFLHDRADKRAYAVLLDLRRHGSESHLEPPLILREGGEGYSPAVQALLEGEAYPL